MPKNFLDLDSKNIWHPFTPLNNVERPIFVESGKGAHLFTKDGKRIIDAVSSWWVNLHGHSNEVIAEAIAAQARKLEHVIFAGFTHEPAIQLSENLLSILPSNQSKIFFSDNGSTAVEVALKMSFQYWSNQDVKRTKVIALEGAYHGDTFGAMSVGERSIFTKPFSDFLFDTVFVTFPEETTFEGAWADFKKTVDGGNVASFIYEPLLQGASGMRMYKAEWLDKMIAYAQANNVICIADEVLTGFGRTGKLFASDYLTTKPDIVALSKGLTGGVMPLGVTSCSEKILEPFRTNDFEKTFFHGHSYTANPLSCAAANASFNLLMSTECQLAITSLAALQTSFANSLSSNSKVKDARALGTISAIELRTPEISSYQNSLRGRIYPYFLDKGILLRPLGNVIYVLPPYVMTEEDLSYVHNAIIEFVNEI
jgi:adenosylmethionine---8-amino-7-oxononanoate aminotransferase